MERHSVQWLLYRIYIKKTYKRWRHEHRANHWGDLGINQQTYIERRSSKWIIHLRSLFLFLSFLSTFSVCEAKKAVSSPMIECGGNKCSSSSSSSSVVAQHSHVDETVDCKQLMCVYMCVCVHAWICRVFNHGSNSVTHAVASSPDQYHIGLIAPCSYYNLPQPTPDKFPLLWIVTVTIYIFCGLCVCDADLSLLVDLPSSIKIDWMCIRMRVTSRHRCRLRRQHQQLIITGTTSMWQPILTSNRTSNIVIIKCLMNTANMVLMKTVTTTRTKMVDIHLLSHNIDQSFNIR